MKKGWKIIISTILMLVLTASVMTPSVVMAEEVSWPTGPSIEAESAIVIEATTGTVLYEKNADELHYPASITKILTTLLALENASLDETVTFSANAVYLNEGDTSHIARDIGEEMTMEQCLYAVMLESANECAYAVAEHVGGGDYDSFISMMNEKAESLGCTNTNFTNANGLPDEEHVTTCRDMALIAQAAIQSSVFRQIISTTKYTIPPTNKHEDETYLNNHHRMINNYKGSGYLYEYAIGGKTGYTTVAGSTLVTYAQKDDMLLICVVMKADSPAQYTDTITLFDYCFEQYTMCNVAKNETRYTTGSSVKTLFGSSLSFAELDTTGSIVLPVSADFADTEVEISYDSDAESGIGQLIYSYGGRQVGAVDIVLTGADGLTYDFGEIAVSDVQSEDSDEVSETASGEESRLKAFLAERIGSEGHRGLRLAILVAALVFGVIVILVLFRLIYVQIYRMLRRRKMRKHRYKVIKQNRKWNNRRRRRY